MRRATQIVVAGLLAGSVVLGAEACSSSSDSDTDPKPGDEGGSGTDARFGPDGELLDGEDPGGNEGGPGKDGGGPDSDAANEGSTGGEAGTSCVGVPETCAGANDCCASTLVTGGTYNRSNNASFPATISNFKLDVYEVTVGRFRQFVEAGKGTQASPPAAGDGLHPKIASSGWDASFNASLPADTAALKAALKCNASFPAWTDAPAGKETNPINCVTWFEAFAFCAWDGGRLPTEAEWNYAAAGGNDQRDYPWGATLDHTKANYDCSARGGGSPNCPAFFSDMKPVGTFSPAGDSKYGQADMSGNVWEYTLDWSTTSNSYRLTSCTDCADLQPTADRTFRGGGFANAPGYGGTALRIYRSPQIADYDVGMRCARDK